MIKKEIIVEKSKKLVNLLQDYGFSFVDVSKMMRNKDVKINGKPIKENVMVLEGDELVFFYSSDMLEKKFDILFENDDVYVLYKYAGIETEGEKGIENVLKNSIAVHRLDRNTEGLMVYAKNTKTAKVLEQGFKKHDIHKFYLTEVVGKFLGKEKKYTAFLVKDNENASVKIFPNRIKDSVEIETFIKPIKIGNESSLLQIELMTGKTHQIRAHLAFLGYPIIGDGKYGKNQINKKFQENKQKLACFRLKFEYLGIEGLDFKEFVRYPKWYHN